MQLLRELDGPGGGIPLRALEDRPFDARITQAVARRAAATAAVVVAVVEVQHQLDIFETPLVDLLTTNNIVFI